ncbi:UNVERIFIED_CONTAM: 50S ribosomal protein L15, chloroplastic [Sesamum radiatum]|uniref:50S ribosomal protein L15, chloroplastic n=1 Tax=Sesamum radiatum TaxID=300843 RepID=A0AAW2V5N9_SESRA
MAASPSSLSSSTPSTTTSLLYHSSSHFKKAKRKGRGHSAGQGSSCGFGMRVRKPGRARSQKGIRGRSDAAVSEDSLVERDSGSGAAFYSCLVSSDSSDIQVIHWTNGCTHAGLPKYVPLNLKDIADAWFKGGEEVSLESLKMKGLISPSGRDRGLPLTILGNVELRVKLNFKTRAFSESAKEKLKAAGRSLTILPGQKKWVKPSGAENIARAEEYFAKKRASSESDDSPST